MELEPDFKEFCELLNRHEVKYMVVGGYAMAAHGHPRYTNDMDFWVSTSEENAEKVVKVLQEFGFGSLGFRKEDFLELGQIIQIGYPPFRIDILTDLSGIQFEDCYQRSVHVDVAGLPIRFISTRDLITNKKSSARDKDLLDVKNLEKAERKKPRS